MTGNNLISFYLFLFFKMSAAYASYYDTLPAGVRNITYHFVKTGEISGNYNSTGNFKGYNLNANINADAIKDVDPTIKSYLLMLSPAEYASFSLGTFEGSANSKIIAEGFGGGYGLTDQLTVYGYIPFYTAEVNLSVNRTAKGQTTAGSLLQLGNLPNVDTRLIQSLVVNYFGYKPLGKWQATNFGDAEFGFLYQLKKWKNAGLLFSVGAVAPSGRIDDPDILQDIAFGDGQWDTFGEFGGGINLSPIFSFDSWTRLTYQFPFSTTLRLPDTQKFPLTTKKGITEIKLGNKAQFNFQGSVHLNEEWTTSILYIFEYKERDAYQSAFEISNAILNIDTEKDSHTAKLNLNYSTVHLYKNKQFFMPLNLNLSWQTIFSGKNIPYYKRIDFETAIYF